MTDEPEHVQEREAAKQPRVSRWSVLGSVIRASLWVLLLGGALAGLLALFHPDSPLPAAWNPTAPLSVADPVTPLTMWKLRRAVDEARVCVETVQAAGAVSSRAPLEASENCHIRNRMTVDRLGQARVGGVETSCAVALRMAMWERHGLQPAARDILGTRVSDIRQRGSYNCRRIRTSQGPSSRWSTHATADAIDVSGFDFADGRRVRLIEDWDDTTAEGRFLRVARDSACQWFATTLGPDYNALHADHFHLQSRGWGACR